MSKENTLMVAEQFYSIQGEGINAGRPSVFLRVTGCNLTCFEENTLVTMADFSLKPIQDIKIGEEVIGIEFNGMLKRTKVLNVFTNENNKRPLVKVSNGEGQVYCTPEHQFRADWWDKNIESGWIEAQKIKSRKIRYFPIEQFSVPDTYDYNLGYLIGSIQGDGHIQKCAWKKGSSVHSLSNFGSIDYEYINAFVDSYKKVFGKSRNIYSNRKTKTGNTFYEIRSSIRTHLSVLNKEMNNWFNTNSEDYKKGFIAGFFDAEGSYSNSENLQIGQVNPKPLQIIQKWLTEFGFNTDLKRKDNQYTSTKEHYELAIFGDIYERIRFFKTFNPKLKRKQEQLYHKKFESKIPGPTKVEITDHKPLYVYDLTTETHNYIANGFLVHNCPGWGTTGCDTTEVWKKGTVFGIHQLVGDWEFQHGYIEAIMKGAMLTITGGEPLLRQEGLIAFIKELHRIQCKPFIEVETNATIVPDADFAQLVDQWNCSPKLSSAGDPESKRINPRALQWFAKQPNAYFKFVINVTKSIPDVDLLEMESGFKNKYGIDPSKILLMPEGATREAYLKNALTVVELCKQSGYRFSPRLHIALWSKTTGV